MANRAVVWEAGRRSLLEGTELVVRDKPRASPGRVVVRMLVRSVSVEESITLDLRYAADPCLGKAVVGMEGCGLIEELGEGVSKRRLGERVHLFIPGSVYEELGEGTWQDYLEIAEEDLMDVPEFMSTEVAAQQLNPWTAYALLVDLNLPKGEYVLQTAAGSTVGRSVIRLAKHWGLKTINVVRRDELKDELKALGADEVINSTTEDVIARVKEITGGRGAYAAFDCVGGLLSKVLASCVRNGGDMMAMGSLESKEFIVSFNDLCRGVTLKQWDSMSHFTQKCLRDKATSIIAKLFEDNIFETRPTWKTFPLEKFKDALLEVQTDRGRHGMVLITN